MSNQFLEKYKEYIIDQYVNQKKSTYEIAQDIGTYPNKIRRTLNTLGVDLRDRSSAQTVAIETGRHEHPTRGKKRTEAEKIAISNGMSNFWDNMEVLRSNGLQCLKKTRQISEGLPLKLCARPVKRDQK